MKELELVRLLEGTQTIESIMDILHVTRQKAIYHVYLLRKKEYVRTKRMSSKKRVYIISFQNRLKGTSYYDIINEYSPLKVAEPDHLKIYGKIPSAEETLVHMLKTKNFRAILASLALFKKTTDWQTLYKLAKERSLERQIGALYDVSRTLMLTRRMPKRYLNHSLPKEQDSWKYIIPGLSSVHFRSIEKKWKVHIPFTTSDLEVYL